MSCDVGEVTESLENELSHSPTLLSPLLHHRFSLTSPGEPPITLTLLIPPPPDRIIIYAPGYCLISNVVYKQNFISNVFWQEIKLLFKVEVI